MFATIKNGAYLLKAAAMKLTSQFIPGLDTIEVRLRHQKSGWLAHARNLAGYELAAVVTVIMNGRPVDVYVKMITHVTMEGCVTCLSERGSCHFNPWQIVDVQSAMSRTSTTRSTHVSAS